jgi:hypothetical protein
VTPGSPPARAPGGHVKLVRSWPAGKLPVGRHHVVDTVERLEISNHDYRALAGCGDVVLLEWDIAVGREELVRFAQLAGRDRGRVLVAPYRLYRTTRRPMWVHRRWDGRDLASARPIDAGDPWCHLFGLGMIYLPGELVDAFVTSGWSRKFGDVEFSTWHYRHVAERVPVTWEAWPVHVNYRLPHDLLTEPEEYLDMTTDDPHVRALLHEYASYLRSGQSERAAEVAAELKARGHDLTQAPQGRTASPPNAATTVAEPPRTGRGSGRKAWAEYAAAIGLDVDDDDGRDDIIDAVDARS